MQFVPRTATHGRIKFATPVFDGSFVIRGEAAKVAGMGKDWVRPSEQQIDSFLWRVWAAKVKNYLSKSVERGQGMKRVWRSILQRRGQIALSVSTVAVLMVGGGGGGGGGVLLTAASETTTSSVAERLQQSVSDFKKSMVGNYENRVREMSNPEKVFQYFASIQRDKEWLMTPQDFARALTPFTCSEEVWAGSQSVRKELPEGAKRVMSIVDASGDGLISYPEYVFFTTLMSIPVKYFQVAFRVMDANNDGCVTQNEFRKVMKVLQSHNPIVQASRITLEKQLDQAVLLPGWFGKDGSGTLTYGQFESFLTDLHGSVIEMIFNNLDSDGDGLISTKEFALHLVSYAAARELPRLARRINAVTTNSGAVSLADLKDWQKVLSRFDELDEALAVFVAGKGNDFNAGHLKRAAKAVAGVDLKDEQLQVVVSTFDDDGNGVLSRNEFIYTLRKTRDFGLSKPRDLGIIRFANCFRECAQRKD